jgi:hypothetical protein
MTEQAPDRIWSGIDISKTVAGALAAVCAAVVGSFLGVAGTLIGAAVASVVASVGTEIYARSINKGKEKLQSTLAPTFVKAPAAVGTPEVAAADDEVESPSHTVAEAPRKQVRWGRVAAVAGVLFVLAMGSLTMVELFTGKSVASTVGNTSSSGTTFGSLLGGQSDATPTPAVSETPSAEPTTTAPGTEPTGEVTETPATGTSTAPSSTAPTSAAPTGTTAPTTAPTDTTQNDSGNNAPTE